MVEDRVTKQFVAQFLSLMYAHSHLVTLLGRGASVLLHFLSYKEFPAIVLFQMNFWSTNIYSHFQTFMLKVETRK